jgi:hypothetical protein
MDEPIEAAPDESFSDDLAAHVRAIVAGAEEQAGSIAARAEADAHSIRERAEAEAAELRERAAREAETAATTRIRRVLEVRRQIADRASRLTDLAGSPAEARRQLDLLLDALTDLADRIAREVAPAGEEALAGVERELLGPEPAAEEPPRRRRFTRRPARQPVNGGNGLDELDHTRLAALRMAVAGATREELELELGADLDGDSVRAVLDDVFGSGQHPAEPDKAALAGT